METLTDIAINFLHELHTQVDGLENSQIPMQSVGANLGLDKNECSELAEELMIDELVELKTLAGEIGITATGLEVLQSNGLIAGGATKAYELSGEVVLTKEDRTIILEILSVVKDEIGSGSYDYQSIEQSVIDIKTLEVQLLSPQPKAAIALAILASLKNGFRALERDEIFAPFGQVLPEER